jgi:hypothetical protein
MEGGKDRTMSKGEDSRYKNCDRSGKGRGGSYGRRRKAALERSEYALPEAVTHGPASCQNEHR